MEKSKGVTRCKGCEACIVACKRNCIKVVKDKKDIKHPIVNNDGCYKCNACKMYCPMCFPVDMKEFTKFYECDEDLYSRDMAKVYRETMRSVREGMRTEFYGTLCQVAALKSLMGDKIPSRLVIYPVECDPKNPARRTCEDCEFYK